MTDLISRADAIEAVDGLKERPQKYYTQYNNALSDAVLELTTLPSAEAVSRVPKGICAVCGNKKVCEDAKRNLDMTMCSIFELDTHYDLSAEAAQGVGRYENAIQKLREMPRYLNGIKKKQITKISAEVVPLSVVDKISEERERLEDRVAELEEQLADTVSREDYHNLLMASNDIDRALREYQAKAEADWIPCSERLPKKGEVVLITNGKGNVRCGQYRSEHDVRDGTHYWWWKGKTVESVLAWMPLPKPYREDGEA